MLTRVRAKWSIITDNVESEFEFLRLLQLNYHVTQKPFGPIVSRIKRLSQDTASCLDWSLESMQLEFHSVHLHTRRTRAFRMIWGQRARIRSGILSHLWQRVQFLIWISASILVGPLTVSPWSAHEGVRKSLGTLRRCGGGTKPSACYKYNLYKYKL
jgi:hypothetical protein